MRVGALFMEGWWQDGPGRWLAPRWPLVPVLLPVATIPTELLLGRADARDSRQLHRRGRLPVRNSAERSASLTVTGLFPSSLSSWTDAPEDALPLRAALRVSLGTSGLCSAGFSVIGGTDGWCGNGLVFMVHCWERTGQRGVHTRQFTAPASIAAPAAAPAPASAGRRDRAGRRAGPLRPCVAGSGGPGRGRRCKPLWAGARRPWPR